MESLKPTLSARRGTAHPPEIIGLRRCVGSHERVPAQELPVPETKEPERKNRRANKPHYEVSVEEFETNVHADLPMQFRVTDPDKSSPLPGPRAKRQSSVNV